MKQALKILLKSDSYINEPFAWDYHVYDLLSLVAYELHYYDEAYLYAKKAFEMNPKSDRLEENVKILSHFVETV